MDRELGARDRLRERARRWRGPLILAGVLLAGGLAVRAWLRPSVELDRLRTARVSRGAIEAVLSAAGVVRAAHELVLASPIEGRVLSVLRRPGALLEAGEPILELDVTASRLSVDRLDGEIEQGEERSRELTARLEEELSAAESRAQVRALDAEQLEYRLTQQRRLHAEGLLAEASLRAAETELEKARIELRGALAAVDSTRRSGAARQAALAAELHVLRSERRAEAERLRRSGATAEQPGVLTWVLEEEGSLVRPGDVLARVADLDSFRVEATISDIHSDRIWVGQAARVFVARERTLDGRVESIHPEVEAGVQRFTVALDGAADAGLRPNLRVEVFVVVDRRDDALTVAKGPFINGAGRQPVFVVEGQFATRHSAVIGLSGWDRYEVVEGLEEGDEVIVSDMHDYLHMKRIRLR